MHQGQHVLDVLGMTSKTSIQAQRQLTSMEAQQLQSALALDVSCYLCHSALALSEGIAGIHAGLSTWATVQLYYSCFYTSRALLGLDDICIFYSHTSPYSIEAAVSRQAFKLKGNTHQATLQEFARRNPHSFFLSQQIKLSDPLDWLRQKREVANYTIAGPCEPTIAASFKAILKSGLRRAIATYLSDTNGLYTFDPDHAMLAFPLRFFEDARTRAKTKGIAAFSEEFKKLMATLLKDRSGQFDNMTKLLS